MTAPVKGTPIPSAVEPVPVSPSPPTPVTTPEATSGVSAQELENERKLRQAAEDVMRDTMRQNTEMQQRLRELDGKVTQALAPPGPSVEERNEAFWKNPVGILREEIKREMTETVAPLNDKLRRSDERSSYDAAKDRLKTQYADIWDKIEGTVDTFVTAAQGKGIAIDDQILNVAAMTATGQYYRNMIPGTPYTPAAPAAPPAPREASVSVPAHLRPSAPPVPIADDKPVARDLTENEERLRKLKGQTKEEYLAFIAMPAKVDDWTRKEAAK